MSKLIWVDGNYSFSNERTLPMTLCVDDGEIMGYIVTESNITMVTPGKSKTDPVWMAVVYGLKKGELGTIFLGLYQTYRQAMKRVEEEINGHI